MNINPISKENAEALAIAGLARLAAEDDLLMRFANLTGILPKDIRSAASNPGFLVGVLDFYLAHEPDLLAWAEADDINPEIIASARFALSPHDKEGFD